MKQVGSTCRSFITKFVIPLAIGFLASFCAAVTPLEQAEKIQEHYRFRRFGVSTPLTPEQVRDALNRNGPDGQNMLQQGAGIVGNVEILAAMNAGEWTAVNEINHRRVLCFMWAAGGLLVPFCELNWDNIAELYLELYAIRSDYLQMHDYAASLRMFGAAFGAVTTAKDSHDIINDFYHHVAGRNTNYVLNQAWALGEDSPEEVEFYLSAQTGMINYWRGRGVNFMPWALAMLEQRRIHSVSAHANADRFRQTAQRYIDGYVTFSAYWDRSAAPARLRIGGVDARAGMGQAIANFQFFVNGVLYESNPTDQLLFWTPQNVDVRVRAIREDGTWLEARQTLSLSPDYFTMDVDRRNFRATLRFPENNLIASRVIHTGIGNQQIQGPVPGGEVTIQFPVDVFSTYTVTTVSTTTNGNQTTSNRIANFSALPLTFPNTYTCLPGDVFGVGDSPIRFFGDLIVPEGITLRLRPGAVLQFAPGKGVICRGRIQSEATNSPLGRVYLTSMGDDSAPPIGGADNSNGNMWNGIRLENGGTADVRHFRIRRAQVGISGASSISNCHITEGNTGAILRLPATVTGSTILGNSRTFLITEHAPEGQVNSLVVSGNTLGHMSGDSRIYGNDERPFNLTFTNNRVDVVQVAGGIGNLVFTGNTGYSTGSPSGLRLGEYWNIPVNLFGNSTLTKEANQRIEVMSGLSLKPGSTLRLEGGLPLQFDSPGRLIMQGGSLIGGVLTAYNDNRDYGGSAGNGQWQGVEANGRPIANLVIRRAGVGINGTSSISNCHITEGNIGAILRLPASVTGSTILGNNRTLLITEQAPDGQANSLVVSGNTLGHLSGDSRIHGHDERPFNLTFTNNRIDVVQVAGGIGNLIFTGNTGSTPGSPSVLRLAWAWSSGIPMNLFGNSTLTKEANQRIEVESSLSLKSGSTLRLEGGLPLQFHGSGRLIMQGGSLIGGVLTAYNDNRDYGGSAGNEQWQGVLSSIAGSFFNVEIRKTAGYAFTSFAGGDQLTSIRFTTPYAVRNLGSAKVDARKSWWNHHNGPSIGSPQSDRGSVVSGSVLYDPWLRSFKGE